MAAKPGNVTLPQGVAPFDSGDMQQDAVFSHTFAVKGTYKYICKMQEAMGMVGTVIVSRFSNRVQWFRISRFVPAFVDDRVSTSASSKLASGRFRGCVSMILQNTFCFARLLLWPSAPWPNPHRPPPWTRCGMSWRPMNTPSAMAAAPDLNSAGEIEPGSDCLHGTSVHFANDKNTEAALKQPFRSKYEIESISRPPGLEQVKAPVADPLPYLEPRHHLSRLEGGHRNLCEPLGGRGSGSAAGHQQDRRRLQPRQQDPKASDFVAPRMARRDRPHPLPRLGLRRALARQWQCDLAPARQRQDAGAASTPW